MKKPVKLSLKERNRLIRRQRTGKDRKKLTVKKRTNRNRIKHDICHSKNRAIVKKINLPEQFDLYENTDKTLEAMNKFREIVNTRNPRFENLDFHKIRHINSSSALMLAAEIDVWNSKVNHQLYARYKTWDEEIKTLLCEMGFFELLKLPPLEKLQITNTTFLKFISGQKSEGEKAKELREKIEQVIGKKLEQKIHLFEGLSEAFTNTRQHAYQEDNSNEYDKWWITASYEKDNKKLVVSMYDRGDSIPATMKTGKKWGFLDERKHEKDSTLIKIAMETSFTSENTRSATGETHRGKGLKQLLAFIKHTGKLTIISKKGYCIFVIEGDKLETKQKKELKYPLYGTLIEWEMFL